eukprot:191139_1
MLCDHAASSHPLVGHEIPTVFIRRRIPTVSIRSLTCINAPSKRKFPFDLFTTKFALDVEQFSEKQFQILCISFVAAEVLDSIHRRIPFRMWTTVRLIGTNE